MSWVNTKIGLGLINNPLFLFSNVIVKHPSDWINPLTQPSEKLKFVLLSLELVPAIRLSILLPSTLSKLTEFSALLPLKVFIVFIVFVFVTFFYLNVLYLSRLVSCLPHPRRGSMYNLIVTKLA